MKQDKGILHPEPINIISKYPAPETVIKQWSLGIFELVALVLFLITIIVLAILILVYNKNKSRLVRSSVLITIFIIIVMSLWVWFFFERFQVRVVHNITYQLILKLGFLEQILLDSFTNPKLATLDINTFDEHRQYASQRLENLYKVYFILVDILHYCDTYSWSKDLLSLRSTFSFLDTSVSLLHKSVFNMTMQYPIIQPANSYSDLVTKLWYINNILNYYILLTARLQPLQSSIF